MMRPNLGNFFGNFITEPVVDPDTREVHYPDELAAREALEEYEKPKPKRKRKKKD